MSCPKCCGDGFVEKRWCDCVDAWRIASGTGIGSTPKMAYEQRESIEAERDHYKAALDRVKGVANLLEEQRAYSSGRALEALEPQITAYHGGLSRASVAARQLLLDALLDNEQPQN